MTVFKDSVTEPHAGAELAYDLATGRPASSATAMIADTVTGKLVKSVADAGGDREVERQRRDHGRRVTKAQVCTPKYAETLARRRGSSSGGAPTGAGGFPGEPGDRSGRPRRSVEVENLGQGHHRGVGRTAVKAFKVVRHVRLPSSIDIGLRHGGESGVEILGLQVSD